MDRVRGSGTDREAGREREGPNTGGRRSRKEEAGTFFVCQSAGDTDMEENQGLPEPCQKGGQRESEAKKT